jgi:hypothetical protein
MMILTMRNVAHGQGILAFGMPGMQADEAHFRLILCA